MRWSRKKQERVQEAPRAPHPTWDEVLARPERLVSDRVAAAMEEAGYDPVLGYLWNPALKDGIKHVEAALLARIEALEKKS